MVVAKTNKGIIIGLSKVNLVRLEDDQPIMFNLKNKGFDSDFQIVIMVGDSEESIVKDLKSKGL